jgi:pimeloyl-ACP methyl ester carboxylesterase
VALERDVWASGNPKPRTDAMTAIRVSTVATGWCLELADGRALGFAEYGDPQGSPVLYFHGTPSSRLERHPNEEVARRLGARVINVERPGYGLSDFQVGRRFLDWPKDVGALADALGLERFAVIGYSGGGPYAAACAYAMPGRLSAVALVSSPSEISRRGVFSGMAPLDHAVFALDRVLPWTAQLLLYAAGVRLFALGPRRTLGSLARTLPEPDRTTIRRPEIQAMMVEAAAGAFAQGSKGYAWDDRLFSRPWGFRPEEIAMPVQLWQGESDVLVPPAMGRALAAAIPHCEATFVPEAGHLMIYERWPEILMRLLA